MRLFIGIPLPEPLKAYLTEVCRFFPSKGLKFVEKGNIHLTIKFLGETERVDEVISALNKVSFKPFSSKIFGLGVFPNERFVRVIHSPVTSGKDEVASLHELIDNELSAVGFKKDTDFTPHVTIARVKIKDDELIKIVNSVKFSLDFTVDSFILFSSKLTAKGPVYSVVHEFKSHSNTST